MKKSKDSNWPSWRVFFRISKLKCFESIFVRVVTINLFVVKKGSQSNAAKEVSTSCLTESSLVFLEMETKFKPLLRTEFSESESRKFSGMVSTVLRLSGDISLVI